MELYFALEQLTENSLSIEHWMFPRIAASIIILCISTNIHPLITKKAIANVVTQTINVLTIFEVSIKKSPLIMGSAPSPELPTVYSFFSFCQPVPFALEKAWKPSDERCRKSFQSCPLTVLCHGAWSFSVPACTQ